MALGVTPGSKRKGHFIFKNDVTNLQALVSP